MWPYTKWSSDYLCAPQENQLCLLPHFLTTLGAQEKTDCINVVISWPRYLPTSITWPYLGLRCRPTKVEYFFEVIRWQVASFEMIAGSSLFFKNSYERCCVYVTMALRYFAFKLTLDAKIQPVILKYRRDRPFLTKVMCWSCSTSEFHALIGQNLTGEFMWKIYAASWNLLTLTAE